MDGLDTGEKQRGYAILASQRSGSSYLGDLLRSTGCLGDPREHLNAGLYPKGFDRSTDPIAIWREIVRMGSSSNGAFAIKLFPGQVLHPPGSQLLPMFSRLPLVWLRRRDLLGQAISLARARQTDQWFILDPALSPANREADYHRASIERCLTYTVGCDAAWAAWIARNGLQPLELYYEDLVAAPVEAVAAIARHADLAAPPPDLAKVRSIQRDAINEEWRERFVREIGGLGRIDLFFLDNRWARLGDRIRLLARRIRRKIAADGTR